MWHWKSEIAPKTRTGYSKVMIFTVLIVCYSHKTNFYQLEYSIQHCCIAWKLAEGWKRKGQWKISLIMIFVCLFVLGRLIVAFCARINNDLLNSKDSNIVL